MKKICFGISIAAILLFLLLCPTQALAASRTGLHLWFDTLLPVLLPFLILSGILIRAGLIRPFVSALAPLFYRLLFLSPGGTYAMIMGFLCGYPMGAKTVSDLTARGQMSPEEAQYLLGFCNNISPSFIITFLVTEQLRRPALLIPAFLILYGAPLIAGILTNHSYRRSCQRRGGQPVLENAAPKETLCFSMIDSCILDAVITIVKLGGYIMLFAILSGIIQVLPVSAKAKALITAAAEITNGIPAVISAFPFPASFLMLMILISFGGMSAIAQTDSVIKNAHLSLGKYVRSKLMISFIAFLLTLCFLI